MTSQPLVAVVVLNWNKAPDTAYCVQALLGQGHGDLRVIVVDNGSEHGSLGPIEALPPSVLLLRNDRNLGFAGGVNVGVTRAVGDGADYVWLMNNDAIPNPDALARCLAAMAADPGVGLVSPVILNADAGDEVEFCGGTWNGVAFQTTADLALSREWHEHSPDRAWLVGTALLIDRRVVEAIGFFDEDLFAYWEDNDYCVRAIRAGFRCAVARDAVVRHWSGRPKTHPGLKPLHYHYYMARNELLFLRKTLARRDRPRPLLWAIDRQFRKIGQLQAYPDAIDAILGGLWDGIRGRGGPYRRDRHVGGPAASILQGLVRVMGR